MSLFPRDDDDYRLAIFAMEREGRSPRFIGHTRYWGMTPDEQASEDWLVIPDEKFERILNREG